MTADNISHENLPGEWSKFDFMKVILRRLLPPWKCASFAECCLKTEPWQVQIMLSMHLALIVHWVSPWHRELKEKDKAESCKCNNYTISIQAIITLPSAAVESPAWRGRAAPASRRIARCRGSSGDVSPRPMTVSSRCREWLLAKCQTWLRAALQSALF